MVNDLVGIAYWGEPLLLVPGNFPGINRRIIEKNYLRWCRKTMKVWRILWKGFCIMCRDQAIPLLEGMSSISFYYVE